MYILVYEYSDMRKGTAQELQAQFASFDDMIRFIQGNRVFVKPLCAFDDDTKTLYTTNNAPLLAQRARIENQVKRMMSLEQYL